MKLAISSDSIAYAASARRMYMRLSLLPMLSCHRPAFPKQAWESPCKLYPAPGRYRHCAGGSLTLSRYPETRVRLDDGTEYSGPGLLMLAIDCVGRGIWIPEIQA